MQVMTLCAERMHCAVGLGCAVAIPGRGTTGAPNSPDFIDVLLLLLLLLLLLYVSGFESEYFKIRH